MEHRQYKNPPIAEAVCSFDFVESPSEFSFPAQLYELLRSNYPIAKTVAVDQPDAHVRIEYASEDNTRRIAVTPKTLSVIDAKPYSGWGTFRQRISDAFDKFQSLSPSEVAAVRIRYLNEIRLGDGDINLDDQFTFVPRPMKGFPPAIYSFLGQVFAGYPESPDVMAQVIFGSVDEEGEPPFRLDITLSWVGEPISCLEFHPDSIISNVVEDLRDKERMVFEALITDTTRRLFDE